ncbi:MAG: ABC transporter permease [Marinilabiliaceae bacterium]|jgi:ABC-2 type transport system permease protein|nr:ABC transporter permease [Marinilabiliaceae bacterium]
MSKTSIIIKREYTSRVKKKSFIIMTLLTPLIFAALMVVPALIMQNEDQDFKKIAVVEDGSDLFKDVIPDTRHLDFEYLGDVDVNQLKNTFEEAGYYGILYLSPTLVNVPNAAQIISSSQPPLDMLEYIERTLEKYLESEKMAEYEIENLDEILKSVKTSVRVQTIRIDDKGETKETNTGIAMGLAYIGAFLMYMIVLLYGVQVMRGVFEEKNNRIVEVIISSVKPVQLMMGKIIGIALVGLTQFAIWIVLMAGIAIGVQKAFLPDDTSMLTEQVTQSVMEQSPQAAEMIEESIAGQGQNEEFTRLFNNLMNFNWGMVIISFFLYFIFGYLLYAAIFAAIGSAVDTETDTQQFMFPIMLPIILGLFIAMGTMQNPESSLSFWGSIIPFTSPIVMMARIPFDVPVWELVLSVSLLAATFFATVFLAAKIYRTGILMYGKKVTFKEMIKWVRYKG